MTDGNSGVHLLSGYGRALGALLMYSDQGLNPSQTEIARSIGMSQNVFANYVKTLTEAGLVTRQRRRGRVYYTVVPTVHPDVDHFRRIMRFLDDSALTNGTEGHPAVLEEVPFLDTSAG